ncbi:hypothetical protein ACFL00_00120 [Pseudomonadota bacterium]
MEKLPDEKLQKIAIQHLTRGLEMYKLLKLQDELAGFLRAWRLVYLSSQAAVICHLFTFSISFDSELLARNKCRQLRLGLNFLHGFRNQAEIVDHALPIIDQVSGELKSNGAEMLYICTIHESEI